MIGGFLRLVAGAALPVVRKRRRTANGKEDDDKGGLLRHEPGRACRRKKEPST